MTDEVWGRLKKKEEMMSKKYAKQLILLLMIICSIIFLPKIVLFFKVDICLDRGGRWDYQQEKCDYIP